MGARLPFFGKPAMRTHWMADNAGNVETNPGPTTTRKQVWICDICHRKIHVRKQIEIRCNRIEHWGHLRCEEICLAQYTDTWTCHQHRELRLTTHTDITPPHPPRPWPNPPTHSLRTPHTPPQPKHRPHFPHVPLEMEKPKPNPVSHSPSTPTCPEPNTYKCHTLTYTSHHTHH